MHLTNKMFVCLFILDSGYTVNENVVLDGEKYGKEESGSRNKRNVLCFLR